MSTSMSNTRLITSGAATTGGADTEAGAGTAAVAGVTAEAATASAVGIEAARVRRLTCSLREAISASAC
jgi:hypothetical protein